MNTNVFVVAACRSPVAPRQGPLRNVDIFTLGATVAEECIRRSGVNTRDIDELVLGNVLGPGGNPARSIGLKLNLNETVAGMTVDRQCVSGLDTLLVAKALIQSGQAQVVLAGGVESYSQRPKVFLLSADGYEDKPIDQAPFTPWPDHDPDMAKAADDLATASGITREQQDEWAVRSHTLARKYQNRLNGEIVQIEGVSLDRDPFTRNLTLETCRRAKTIVGAITHANAAVAADGAAFLVVVSEQFLKDREMKGLRVGNGTTMGDNPLLPGLAAVPAIKKAMQSEGLRYSQITAIELMEAYSAQTLACMNSLNLDTSRINRKGGALARGHPVGASGAILAVRLFHELLSDGGYGLAAIPSAGGIGTAVVMEA